MPSNPDQQTPPTTPVDASSVDPLSVIRTRTYLRALILAAAIGAPISIVAYGFLALVDQLQETLFDDLPIRLGFDDVPIWWPLPLLTLAGLLVALCIQHLPGTSGHSPSKGFTSGAPPLPIELPGVALAALATLSLGVVLGPEAPLIAIGSGLGALAAVHVRDAHHAAALQRLVRGDAPRHRRRRGRLRVHGVAAGAGSAQRPWSPIGSCPRNRLVNVARLPM